MDAIGEIDVPMARRAKQGGIALGAAAEAMASRLRLGISLGFHHHAPQQAAACLAFHQAAADEFRAHHLRGTAEEGSGKSREFVGDELGNYWEWMWAG